MMDSDTLVIPTPDSDTGVSSSPTRRLPGWATNASLNARAQEIGSPCSGTRRLPNWNLTSRLNVRGQGNRGKSQKVSSPKRVPSSEPDIHSSTPERPDHSRPMVIPSSDPETGVSSSCTRRLPGWASNTSLSARAQDINTSTSSSGTRRLPNWKSTSNLNVRAQGKRGSSHKVSSPKRVAYSEADFHSSTPARPNHSVMKFDRRALPAHYHPSVSQTKTSSFRHVDGFNQINKGPGTSLSIAKTNREEDIQRGHRNDVTMLDNSGSRILPTWSSIDKASSTDPLDPFRNSDEKKAGPDESSVLQAVIQDLNQPTREVDLPDGLLSVPLLRHQKIALAWMCQKEARLFCVGGILADDQGLGKTVSMIALILMHKHSEQKFKSEDHHTPKIESLNLDEEENDSNKITNLDGVELTEDSQGMNSSRACSPHKHRATAGTLVVCPATVLRQWVRELNDKVTEEAKLDVLMYHGSSRTKDPLELAKYDVVVTTYTIVANEVPKHPLADQDDAEPKAKEKKGTSSSGRKRKKGRKSIASCLSGGDSSALARVSWLRVVLDEAQSIKNHKTQVARACWGLRAKKRWCLSGTPIQNTVDELFSYFRFLKYDPYSSYKSFCKGLKVPISKDSQYGYQKLQAVLRTVMLRRTKVTSIDGNPVINLPPKYINLKKNTFTLEEREFYNKLEGDSRSQFKAYALAGTVRKNYANILLMLMRLRLACNHPLLALRLGSNSARKTSSILTSKKLSKEKLMNLLNCLENSRICQLCADPPEDAVVAVCGHVFCDLCLSDHLDGDDITCPAFRCKEKLNNDIVYSEATLRSWLSYGSDSSLSMASQPDESSFIFSSDYCSSKIKAALELLQSFEDGKTDLNYAPSEGPKKAIVFSQWTRMLDLMESSLQRSDFQYRRLDGRMTLAARDKAVREFSSDPEVTVMLMSLKAGNLGLNMVAACHVILLDLWWNPTTEDQAVDRAHRIGQMHPVTVSRLTIKDTVEDRILALQEKKRKMVASAFGEENGDASASGLSLHDLKFLFTGAR